MIGVKLSHIHIEFNLIGNRLVHKLKLFSLFFQLAIKILDVIIEGNLSFQVAQLQSLRELLEIVSGRKILMPTRYRIMLTLKSEFAKVKTGLVELISKQKYVCTTADVWTSHAQSFLGVTVHFINSSFKRESYLLAFKQLVGRQTYDVLAKALDEIFKDYSIDVSKITHIATDGGSAFCKMFKKYGEQMDVVVLSQNQTEIELTGENTPEIFEDDENGAEEGIVTLFMLDEHGNHFVTEEITLDSGAGDQILPNISSVDDVYGDYFGEIHPVAQMDVSQLRLPRQRRCYSHLLNLLSPDFEKNLEGVAKTLHKSTFSALHSLWLITRTSPRAKQTCKEILGIQLMFPCETRWNSKFDCVRQLNK